MKFLNLLYKNNYLLLAGILFFASCQSSTKSNENTEKANVGTNTNDTDSNVKILTINGTIKSPPKNGTVVLEKLNNRRYVAVDTSKLSGGKFVFEVKISEPEFYRVVMFKKQAVHMVLTDKDLEIIADAAVPEIPYTVKGSKDMDYYRVANRIVNKLGKEQNALASQYVLAKKNEEAKAKDLYKQLMTLQKNGIAQIKGMIDTIQPSIAALYASNILNPEEEFVYMKTLGSKLQKRYPHSRYVNSMVKHLVDIEPWTIGKVAPEIALKSPEGKEITLSSLKGKLVLIDFWASWCKPCRMENPNVVKVYDEYKNKGFEILGVSLDRDKQKWVGAIANDKLSWLHVSDLKFWQSEAAIKYNVKAIPKTFLIDKEGKILAKDLRGDALRERIAKELN